MLLSITWSIDILVTLNAGELGKFKKNSCSISKVLDTFWSGVCIMVLLEPPTCTLKPTFLLNSNVNVSETSQVVHWLKQRCGTSALK